MLIQEASRIEEEMDSVIDFAKKNPIDNLHKGPVAPHAENAQELAMETRIGEIGGRAPSILSYEPAAARGVSLLEQSGRIGIDLKNTIEATLVQPNFNLPPPADDVYYAARAAWNRTVPSEIETRLRKLWPKPVNLDPAGPLIADEYMNADEILPRDPEADSLLHHFNQKYGVFDDKGIPFNLPAPPDSELLPRNDQNLTDVERDYVSVFDSANKFGFDPEKDSIANLDKMLASMWRKRWEFFASEKQAAEERIKAQQAQADPNTKTYPIEVLFPQRQANPDHTGESLLGDVYTYLPEEKPVLPYIENREHFVPQTEFYGPAVTGKAIDLATRVPDPDQVGYFQPEYHGPEVHEKQTIKLIPASPAAADPAHEMVDPFVKDGEDFNPLLATPATIMKLPKFPKKKPLV